MKRERVWAAISDAGIVKIFIIESCKSMNKTRYIEVLGNFLLPIMDTICKGSQNCYFWPDLAQCHYAQEVLNWLESK